MPVGVKKGLDKFWNRGILASSQGAIAPLFGRPGKIETVENSTRRSADEQVARFQALFLNGMAQPARPVAKVIRAEIALRMHQSWK